MEMWNSLLSLIGKELEINMNVAEYLPVHVGIDWPNQIGIMS